MPPGVSAGIPRPGRPVGNDAQHWIEGLRSGSPGYRRTTAELHAMLLRVARHELGRRRHALGSIGGPELEDLAQQSASDAMSGRPRRRTADPAASGSGNHDRRWRARWPPH